MPDQDVLIHFKTNAWKSDDMVANYAKTMHENRGTTRLKNQVEVSLCRENIVGKSIVDVGVGTGRGSLPLAREGYTVTGIDVSQAMLEQCRREAGETPIDLIAGDLTSLPVADESFDSLIALNVAVHFPNWRDALKDWVRVVKPNGRLVFDVHSYDHLLAASEYYGCAPEDLLTPELRSDPAHFMLRLRACEIAEAARECGLCVVALVPYAAVFGGGNVNYWLRDSRLWGYLGDRALSWMAIDEQLFNFGAFVEQSVMSRLSTAATGRFMVVLEKRADDETTRKTLEHQDIVADAFKTCSPAKLRGAIGAQTAEMGSALKKHLEYKLNRTFLAMMLSSPAAAHLRPFIVDIAGEEIAQAVYVANERQRIDTAVERFVRTWHKPDICASLTYEGVDLSRIFEYDLMRDVLDAEFFSGCERPT